MYELFENDGQPDGKKGNLLKRFIHTHIGIQIIFTSRIKARLGIFAERVIDTSRYQEVFLLLQLLNITNTQRNRLDNIYEALWEPLLDPGSNNNAKVSDNKLSNISSDYFKDYSLQHQWLLKLGYPPKVVYTLLPKPSINNTQSDGGQDNLLGPLIHIHRHFGIQSILACKLNAIGGNANNKLIQQFRYITSTQQDRLKRIYEVIWRSILNRNCGYNNELQHININYYQYYDSQRQLLFHLEYKPEIVCALLPSLNNNIMLKRGGRKILRETEDLNGVNKCTKTKECYKRKGRRSC